MKLHFLGTCAGSEPQPDCRHASFALETGGRLYWFDAGEGCSHTAHNLGLDLLSVGRIVISHPHMDHVGGLGNLLWNIRKLHTLTGRVPLDGKVTVHMPNMETWEGLMLLLRNTEGNFSIPFEINASPISDGLLFDDGVLKVTALSNGHLPPFGGKPQSFSFLIEGEGKRVVYSGDVGAYRELDPFLIDGCDRLIIETGHHGIDDVFSFVKGKGVGKVCFFHNGREFINDPDGSARKVERLFGEGALVARDGLTETV